MTSTATPLTPRRLNDSGWQDRAACRGVDDPDLFFPEPKDTDKITAAKQLCSLCPVNRTCLDAALEAGDRHGIRGGLTQRERRRLHRRFQQREDSAHIDAALAGRDIYLTFAERHIVTAKAHELGIGSAQLARILRIERDYATTLLREEAENTSAENTTHDADSTDDHDQWKAAA